MKLHTKIYYKLRAIKRYIQNRFIKRIHIIKIKGMVLGLEYEFDEKLYLAITQLFEDFYNRTSHFLTKSALEVELFNRIYRRKTRLDAYAEEYNGPEFIDRDGNETDRFFTENHINEFHPKYSEYLDKCGQQDELNRYDDTKILNDILRLRYKLGGK